VHKIGDSTDFPTLLFGGLIRGRKHPESLARRAFVLLHCKIGMVFADVGLTDSGCLAIERDKPDR
jgi:hypothetical protein